MVVGKSTAELGRLKVGDTVEVVIQRGDKEVVAPIALQQRMDKHVFEEMDKITEQQKFLRDVWKQNL